MAERECKRLNIFEPTTLITDGCIETMLNGNNIEIHATAEGIMVKNTSDTPMYLTLIQSSDSEQESKKKNLPQLPSGQISELVLLDSGSTLEVAHTLSPKTGDQKASVWRKTHFQDDDTPKYGVWCLEAFDNSGDLQRVVPEKDE